MVWLGCYKTKMIWEIRFDLSNNELYANGLTIIVGNNVWPQWLNSGFVRQFFPTWYGIVQVTWIKIFGFWLSLFLVISGHVTVLPDREKTTWESACSGYLFFVTRSCLQRNPFIFMFYLCMFIILHMALNSLQIWM